jgi:hypothetical protein
MLINKRKIRLAALSSIVCLQADPPVQTLWAGRIWPLRTLEKLENREVFSAFPPSQMPNPLPQNGCN